MIKLDKWFQTVGREQTLLKGETLFLRGDVSRGPFLVQSGRVRLFRQDENGSEITLHLVHPGERFAEASVFSDAYHCDCTADEKSTVLAIPKAEILTALENQSAFAALLASNLARQVMELRTRLELRNIRAAEERILAALILKSGGHGMPFELDGTLKNFATEIGLTHETLYRNLKKLEDGGHLRRNGRAIEIL